MNMQLLIEETKRIAYGHAWSIQYEVTSYSAIPEEPQIHVYIERPFGCAHADIANTYQGALDNLKRAMHVDRPIPDEAPPEEVHHDGQRLDPAHP
jgi:hypothetical protein